MSFIGVALYGNPETTSLSNAWELFGAVADDAGISRIGKDIFGLQIYHPKFPKRFELTYMACMGVPFVVVDHEFDCQKRQVVHRYHFCCLGVDVGLPYSRECREHSPPIFCGVIPRIIIQKEEEEILGVCTTP